MRNNPALAKGKGCCSNCKEGKPCCGGHKEKTMSAIDETTGGALVGGPAKDPSMNKSATKVEGAGEFESFINGLPAKEKNGLHVWVNHGPPKMVIIDFMDWWDGDMQKEIKSEAAKWAGDEQNVMVHNEGGKPDATAGWTELKNGGKKSKVEKKPEETPKQETPPKVVTKKQYKIHCRDITFGKEISLEVGQAPPTFAKRFCIKDENGKHHDNRYFPNLDEAERMLVRLNLASQEKN